MNSYGKYRFETTYGKKNIFLVTKLEKELAQHEKSLLVTKNKSERKQIEKRIKNVKFQLFDLWR